MTATVRGISPTDRSGSIDDKGDREYTVQYKVTTDDREDGPEKVRTAFGLPNIGDLYAPGNDFDAAAVVTGKEVSATDSPWEWTVEVTYSTAAESGTPIVDDNPLNADAEISYGFQSRRVLLPGAYNDPRSVPQDRSYSLGIYNVNGELFNPQPEIEINEPVVTIKRNVASIDGPTMMALANSVNADYWQDAEPRTLRLLAPQADRAWHKACGYYWRITYQIAYRHETWDVQLLNQGTYYFKGGKPTLLWASTTAGGKRRSIRPDDAGNPTIVNLSTNGDLNETSTPVWLRYRVFRELDFGSLGLI